VRVAWIGLVCNVQFGEAVMTLGDKLSFELCESLCHPLMRIRLLGREVLFHTYLKSLEHASYNVPLCSHYTSLILIRVK
jgi:hypothetical protein